jgi:hypothetical protein
MTGATGATALTLRAFDAATDLPGVVELIGAVNSFDDLPYFPTVETLVVDWAPTPRFDPARDVVVALQGGRIVAAAH